MTSIDAGKTALLPLRGDLKTRDVEENFRRVKDSIRSLADQQSSTAAAVAEGHYQETFTATGAKTVNHNLGSHVQVSVYDSAGTRIQTIVNHVDDDTAQLQFTGTLTNAVVVVDVGVS